MAEDIKKRKKKIQKEAEEPEEEVLFTSLRAVSWDEFHGQENLKKISRFLKSDRSHYLACTCGM
jgi:hypothetical protein